MHRRLAVHPGTSLYLKNYFRHLGRVTGNFRRFMIRRSWEHDEKCRLARPSTEFASRKGKTAAMPPAASDHVERDEYFVRRLEAFGDIVIGFSLALLALTLIVPSHAAALLRDWVWFAAYVWTFAFVCSMWGAHYWTFRYVFMPTRLSLFLNYAKLGLIVLLIFTVQVLLRSFEFGNARDVVVANELYWGCLSAYWIVAALLLATGIRLRGASLAPEIARACVRRIWRVAATVPMIAAGIAIAAQRDASAMASTVALFMIAGLLIGVCAGRIAIR
jgi:uncharacterized membrane protein